MPDTSQPYVLWDTRQPAPVVVEQFHTVRERASANAMARDTTREAVRFRRDEVSRFLAVGLEFIAKGKAAAISSDYLDDFAKGLSDAVSDAVGSMRKDLDGANLDPDAADVDVAELDALIEGAAS